MIDGNKTKNGDFCEKMAKIFQSCNSINNINITYYVSLLIILILSISMVYKYIKQRQLNKKLA